MMASLKGNVSLNVKCWGMSNGGRVVTPGPVYGLHPHWLLGAGLVHVFS